MVDYDDARILVQSNTMAFLSVLDDIWDPQGLMRKAFRQEVADMPFPSRTRNVAVSNGSGDGSVHAPIGTPPRKSLPSRGRRDR